MKIVKDNGVLLKISQMMELRADSGEAEGQKEDKQRERVVGKHNFFMGFDWRGWFF